MKNILRIADEKSEKIQIIMALLLISASAIPLLLLCRYAVPINDDLNIDFHYINPLQATINVWLNWQGTYAFRFCDIFNFPLFWGVSAYPEACAAIVLVHLGAWLFAIRSVLVNVFSCKKWNCILWVFSAVVFNIANFINPGEIFFWFTGASVYTYPLSMLLFAVGFYTMTFHTTKRRKVAYSVIAALCLFWACGGAAVIAAFSCSVFLYCSLQSLFSKSHIRRVTLVLFGCCLVFALLNALAPGNFARRLIISNLHEDPPVGLFMAFMRSFTVAIPCWINYVEQFAIISLLLALPCREIIKDSDRKIFRWPLASFIFALAAVVVCIFPAAFGYGTEVMVYSPHRYINTFNSVFFGAVLFLAILFWGFGFTRYKQAFGIGSNKRQRPSLPVVSVYIAALLLIGFNYAGTHAKSLNTVTIIEDIRNGTLKNYKELHNAAFEYAANTEEEDIIITLPEAYPLFPLFPPSPQDNEFWSNRAFALYFGLNSVTVQEYIQPIE